MLSTKKTIKKKRKFLDKKKIWINFTFNRIDQIGLIKNTATCFCNCLFDQLERCADNRIRYGFTVYEIYTTYMHIQTIKKYLCNQGLRTKIS